MEWKRGWFGPNICHILLWVKRSKCHKSYWSGFSNSMVVVCLMFLLQVRGRNSCLHYYRYIVTNHPRWWFKLNSKHPQLIHHSISRSIDIRAAANLDPYVDHSTVFCLFDRAYIQVVVQLDFNRNLFIKNQFSEPGFQHQNNVGPYAIRYLKQAIGVTLDHSGASDEAWFFAAQHMAKIHNRTHRDFITPFQAHFGRTPDISDLITFRFWE